MATTNYSWTLATVGGSTDTWGTITNTVFDNIDAQVFINATAIAANLPLAGGTLTGALTGTVATFTTSVTSPTFVGALSGNSTTSTTLETARDFTLAGVITAVAASFDGSANLEMTTAIADAALTIAKTSGLQTALDAKLSDTGDTITGDITQSGKGVYTYHGDSALASGEITVSTSAPSGGANGDIWYKY